MIALKSTIKTESIYSDDNQKRYSFSIEWDKQKRKQSLLWFQRGVPTVYRLTAQRIGAFKSCYARLRFCEDSESVRDNGQRQIRNRKRV